ncbi:hypothetical protein [Streptomyces sp. NRRL S-31]|uniref:hypothetical protein n=1 Tax=Streptomyces sp. NRRL S-31 TaxID=1463898 RepID=UPI0004C60A08|nr:hypothetical protein [Streptomyces sp. NRRL S-31]
MLSDELPTEGTDVGNGATPVLHDHGFRQHQQACSNGNVPVFIERADVGGFQGDGRRHDGRVGGRRDDEDLSAIKKLQDLLDLPLRRLGGA